jgi:hypothetical protein
VQRLGELTRLRGPEPRVERRLLDVLDRDEISCIEEAAATERDKLIVRVLADTGIRVGSCACSALIVATARIGRLDLR